MMMSSKTGGYAGDVFTNGTLCWRRFHKREVVINSYLHKLEVMLMMSSHTGGCAGDVFTDGKL